MPNHFTLTFFLLRRRDVSCSHSNRDLFTCEDNMLFSQVKISCFRTKAHLVFHWCLYNKVFYSILYSKALEKIILIRVLLYDFRTHRRLNHCTFTYKGNFKFSTCTLLLLMNRTELFLFSSMKK